MLELSLEWDGGAISRVAIKPHGMLHSNHPLVQRWLDAYLSKKPIPFPLPLRLAHLPRYTQNVLREVANIPFGETASYSEIAKRTKNPRAMRAVGTACGRNPYPLFIPCHRVTGKRDIGGFSCHPSIKTTLLNFEAL